MKKFILPLLLILSIGLLIAAESEASDVVGYFKVSVPVDSWTPMSMPFQIVTGTASSVFGENWASSEDYTVADQLVDAYNGVTTSYYTGYGWDIEDNLFVEPGHIYWANRTQPNLSPDVFLLGKVAPQPITLSMNGQDLGGWTPFSLNDAVSYYPSDLGFTVTEPDWDNGLIDRIVCSNNGRTAEYWGAEYGGWTSLDEYDFLIEPSYAYYYFSNQPTTWVFSTEATRINNQINVNKRSTK